MKITRIKHAHDKSENDGIGEPCIPGKVLISNVRAVLFYDLIGIHFDYSVLLDVQRHSSAARPEGAAFAQSKRRELRVGQLDVKVRQ